MSYSTHFSPDEQGRCADDNTENLKFFLCNKDASSRKYQTCVRDEDDCPITDMRFVFNNFTGAMEAMGYTIKAVPGQNKSIAFSKSTNDYPLTTFLLEHQRPCLDFATRANALESPYAGGATIRYQRACLLP
mmetsp:Transcript_33025/g.50605  ORF Transcript_33025/g.50605 Transcript_33025/m.50605 type:complete len:132 (+) Transcript_33025:470-865(+)